MREGGGSEEGDVREGGGKCEGVSQTWSNASDSSSTTL